MNFSELSLPAVLLQALADHGYDTPTPVQTLATEEKCHGHDLLVSARTGSGKTIAFGLAMGESVIGEDGSIPPAGKPLALVIAPTRELALQVQTELNWLYAKTLAHVRSCVGGMDVRREAFQLANGAHIVVGTPGRLCDHLDRGRLDLSQIRTVVLDEADEMLDMGFREELETLLKACPTERRTLLFSATLPRAIEEMAQAFQNNPLRIAADPPREAHSDIEHRACLIAPRERDLAVVNILREHDAKGALVFCSTREAVSRLQANLSERGFAATAISGELTQAERSRALKMLRDGHARVLVATDVAARGLDLPALDLVIHADPPRDAQVMQHRSGRTGRAGRKGVSVLLVPYRVRYQAERMFRQLNIPVQWHKVPTMDEIHALDRERLGHEVVKMCSEVGKDELEIAQLLLEELSPDQLAAALVRQCYAKLPVAEDLPETNAIDARTKRPMRGNRSEGFGRGDDFRRDDNFEGRNGFGKRRFEDRHTHMDAVPEGVCFKLSVGRQQGADPRWLIPLICKRGGIQKRDIGKIDILNRESRFYVTDSCAAMFEQAISAAPTGFDGKDASIRIEKIDGTDAFGTHVDSESLRDERRDYRPRGDRHSNFGESRGGYVPRNYEGRREGDGFHGGFKSNPSGKFRGDFRREDRGSFHREFEDRRAFPGHCTAYPQKFRANDDSETNFDDVSAPRPKNRGVDFAEERKKSGAQRRADIAAGIPQKYSGEGSTFDSPKRSFNRASDRFDPVYPAQSRFGAFGTKRMSDRKKTW